MSDVILNDIIDSKHSIDAFIGQKLRDFRLKSGVTLSEIAKRMNLSMQLIQKYETGVTKIPVSALCRLASIFNIRPSDFFEGYDLLVKKPKNKLSLSAEKNNHLNVLLVSVSIEINYIIQNLATETELNISLFNLTSPDDIHDYARHLICHQHNIPIPDIILYDIPTHRNDVSDFIKKIRLKPMNLEAPIIILSANTDVEPMKRAYYQGVAGYIYKNTSLDDLKQNLKYTMLYWGKSCNLAGTIPV